MTKKLFILGVGRSGTSLLQTILHHHSEIFFLKENQILKNILRGTFYNCENGFELHQKLKQTTNIDRVSTDSNFIDLSSPLNAYNSIIEKYISSQNKNLSYIGDKDPGNIDYFDQIFKTFPDSKFLLIVRDPRAVIASRMKAEWSRKYPFLFHPLVYYAQQKICFDKLEKNPSLPVLTITYHNLVNNPKQEMQRITNWLQLEYEEKCLEFHKTAGELIDPNELSWKKDLLKPITNQDEKWKYQLKNYQIRIIEYINHSFLKEFELKSIERKPSLPLLLFFELLAKIFTQIYKIYRRV